MNLKRLLLLTALIFCFIAINISFAKTGKLGSNFSISKVASGDKAVAESGEKAEVVSGDSTTAPSKEETKEISGEAVKESGEKAEVVSGEAPVVSGEEAKEVSGEAPVVSGEVAEVVSGETPVVSGDVAEVVSGEVPVVSGEEVEVASGDEVIVAKANDIEDNRWYAEYVNSIVGRGIMELDENGNFNPTSNVTKADVVEAVYNLPGRKSGDELEWAQDNGIIAKDEDVSAIVTREDIAVIIYNYVKSYGGGFTGSWRFILSFDDRYEISEDALESISWCVMNDIIIGKTDDTVNAKDIATRAELATIIYRLADAK